MPFPESDPLLPPRELAVALKCGLSTVNKKSRAGLWPFYPIGKVRRYRLAEVLAAIRQDVEPSLDAAEALGRVERWNRRRR